MSPSAAVESVPPRHTVVTENLVASGIVLMLTMFWIAFYQRIPEIGADSSCYIGLAQSLTIGAYEFNYQNHTIYPPGFPLLLALLSALARREPAASYAIFMPSIAVGAGLTLLVSYWLIRSLVNARWALVYVALAGASPFMFSSATRLVGSDIPYSLASLGALLVFHRIKQDAISAKTMRARWLVFLVLLVITLAMRAIGIALLVGLALWCASSWVFSRRRPPAALVAVLVVGLLEHGAWEAWTRLNTVQLSPGETDDNYIDDFFFKDPHKPELGNAGLTDLGARPFRRFREEASHVSEFFVANKWIDPFLPSPLVMIPAILIAVGALVSLAGDGRGLTEMYFLVYAVILSLWPYDVGPRYIFPILPLCFIYLYRGWNCVVRWGRQHQMGAGRLLGAISAGMVGAVAYHWASGAASTGMQRKGALAFWTVGVLAGLVFSGERASERFRWLWTPTTMALGWVPYVYLAGAVAGGMHYQVRMARDNVDVAEAAMLHYPTAEAARWLGDHTASDAVVMTFNHWVIHSISHRRAVVFPATENAATIVEVARKHRASFLVVLANDSWQEPPEEARLRAVATMYPSMLELVHAGAQYRIFRFRFWPEV